MVKDPSDLDEVKRVFHGTGVNITCEGRKHLGAAIGTTDFKEAYVKEKITSWVEMLEKLSEVGKTEPHAAYSSYVFGLSHKWRYLQRTVPDVSHLFQRLEDTIYATFIPAIVGRNITPLERKLMSLPAKLGGMGIGNPVEDAPYEYEYSKLATKNLQAKISDAQNGVVQEIENISGNKQEMSAIQQLKKERLQNKYNDIYSACGDQGLEEESELQRAITLAKEKGSSAWLTTLPLESMNYNLNRQEFHDAIAMRYCWPIIGMPKTCACSKLNSIDHALSCPNGGYVIMRHNELRNLEATFLKEVCKDVQVEPPLIPLNGEQFSLATAACEDEAKLDVSCRGFFSRMDKTFFDVRVTHLNVSSNRSKDPIDVYIAQEKEKKRKYGERVIEVEKASMIPLVFSTNGGYGPECDRYHKRLAELLSVKTGERYSDTIRTLRLQIRFSLLRTTLIAIRGFRAPQKCRVPPEIKELDFGINPMVMSIE